METIEQEQKQEAQQQQEQQEQPQGMQIDPAIEQEAVKTGWVPKEQFKGDPSKWRPADQWVERGREYIPFIKAEKRELEGKVSDLTAKLDQTTDMMRKMVQIQSKYSDDFYDTKIADIKTRKRQAAEEQDWDLYDNLDAQETTIKKPEPLPDPSVNQGAPISPGMQRWVDENKEWFKVDKDLTDYAVFLANKMETEGSPLIAPGREYELGQEVKKNLERIFPDKFKNPNQQRSDFDESHLRSPDLQNRNKGKTWNDLPDVAKAQCEKLITEIPNYTKEQYIKDYFEDS